MTVHLGSKTAKEEQLRDGLIDCAVTHPAKQGKPYRFAYALETVPERDTLRRIALETGDDIELDLGDLRFPGEPTVCPSRDAVWILSSVYDAKQHKSGVAVIADEHFGDGPVGWVWFDHPIPPPLHGMWLPG
jgi:carotenoid cleavage dioxygenase-like enzyme